MQETPVRYLAQEDPLEKGQATHSSVLGFPGSSTGKESTCNVEDLSSIPELGRSLEEGMATHTCLENPHGQSSLLGYSPWGHKESDVTEQRSTAHP